jgi:hypothetical protein
MEVPTLALDRIVEDPLMPTARRIPSPTYTRKKRTLIKPLEDLTGGAKELASRLRTAKERVVDGVRKIKQHTKR